MYTLQDCIGLLLDAGQACLLCAGATSTIFVEHPRYKIQDSFLGSAIMTLPPVVAQGLANPSKDQEALGQSKVNHLGNFSEGATILYRMPASTRYTI